MRVVKPRRSGTVTARQLVLAAVGAFILSPAPANAQNLILAEYRADTDPTALSSLHPPLDLDVEESYGDGVTAPWGRSTRSIRGTVPQTAKVGGYSLTGFFDISLSRIGTLDRYYGMESSLSVGPQISLGPASKTYLFYSLNQAETDRLQGIQWGGDSYTQSTGFAYAWQGRENRMRITLGYEYEYGSTEDLYAEMRAHSISLSGRFPLLWGVYAEVEADYSKSSYLDYQNNGAADSKRRLFRAAVERSFSEQLYGGLQFSYSNENFGDNENSSRRRAWGFNLKYEY